MSWLTKFLRTNKQTRRAASPRRRRPALESLETRTLLSANLLQGSLLRPGPIATGQAGVVLELFSKSSSNPAGVTLADLLRPEKSIAVKSFSFEVERTSDPSLGAGSGKNNGYRLDIATRDLFAVPDGQDAFSMAVLKLPGSNAGAEWVFSNVVLNSEQLTGKDGGFTENVEFLFQHAQERFVQPLPTGSALPTAATAPYILEQGAASNPVIGETQSTPGSPGGPIAVSAFSFSLVNANTTKGAGNGGTLNFTTTSLPQAGLVVRDVESNALLQSVTLHTQTKDAASTDDFLFGSVTPESVQVSGDAGKVSVDVTYSYRGVTMSEHQNSSTAGHPSGPVGPELYLAVNNTTVGGNVIGETQDTDSLEREVTSFSVNFEETTGSETGGAGAGKSSGFLDVTLSGPPVSPLEFHPSTRLALLQRTTGGKTAAELDFDGVQLTSAVVTGANGDVSEDLQFNFGAVTVSTPSASVSKTSKIGGVLAEKKAEMQAQAAADKKAAAEKKAEELAKAAADKKAAAENKAEELAKIAAEKKARELAKAAAEKKAEEIAAQAALKAKAKAAESATVHKKSVATPQ